MQRYNERNECTLKRAPKYKTLQHLNIFGIFKIYFLFLIRKRYNIYLKIVFALKVYGFSFVV